MLRDWLAHRQQQQQKQNPEVQAKCAQLLFAFMTDPPRPERH
jgi:hypothetical protein